MKYEQRTKHLRVRRVSDVLIHSMVYLPSYIPVSKGLIKEEKGILQTYTPSWIASKDGIEMKYLMFSNLAAFTSKTY